MNPRIPTLAQSTWLVAEREITTRLRSKAFLISTGILFAIILASILISGFTADTTSKTAIAATPEVMSQIQGDAFDITEVATTEEATQLVLDGEVNAAVVSDTASDNPLGLKILADTEAPAEVQQALSISPPVEILTPNPNDPFLLYIISLAFGVVFLISASTFGGVISQSVVEEKQTRIVEILMSAIPVRAMLAGKVIGNSILAFLQIAVIAALSVIGLTATGQTALLDAIGLPIAWFVIFFTIGFVLLAAMFAASASMVARMEDIGSVTTPVTMLVMIPYFLVVFFNDNPVVLTIMSYVPFSAPVGMPVRLFVGGVQWWEPLVSLAILVLSTLVVIALGSRIYQGSLLRTSGRVKLAEALTAGKA
ncbi:ABC transporter permease [Klugiella xanthotipulae]|uniref:ABC-2 type transport system permease protein n=1 Tax=Klugiella xanthotipulae TaxID=244735 RepID=A0A543I6I6_9MICO|nr:ABC transporter permease [Klugiella xanthotipulae]TQM66161.1 ABC-2 type transport system permease protein [Klugiella xanthotipulae]